MSTYTIGEVAHRSGFTTSALRYYEGIGLLEPAGRSAAGYRLYDDDTLGRLAFIGRAKQLGCSLEEIADLVAVWDGDRCAPVQRRFHELVTAKLAEASHQVLDLTALVDQLRSAASRLAGPASDGPCGDGCACLSPATDEPVQPWEAAEGDQPPIACTLDAHDMADRVAAWRAVLDRAQTRSSSDDGTLRVEFGGAVDLTELAGLVAAEQQCCAFFAFAITVDPRGIGLEVRAPAGARHLVESVFGSAPSPVGSA